MHRYEKLVLDSLKGGKELALEELVKKTGIGRDEVLWALENLSVQGLVEAERAEANEATLTQEGTDYANSSLPETKLLKKLKEGTVDLRKLNGKEEQIGFQQAKRKGLVIVEDGLIMLGEKGVKQLEDGLPEDKALKQLQKDPGTYEKLSAEIRDELAKRGLIETKTRRRVESVRITQKGIKAEDTSAGEGIGALTKGIIANQEWKNRKFKRYDINVPVGMVPAGKRNPLSRNIEDIKRAYLANGFREVTGPVIDSAFWVFDSLFQPQDHPARDAQDTFYLKGIEEVEIGSEEFVKRVKKAHTEGWHYRWSLETAKEAVLRTHTTSVTARHIYDILSAIGAETKEYEFPMKLFSVGRIFRNENIDYRHLADFYQSDGIVIGKGLTFANLFDQITKLYDWLGVELKFKPSYFPFVEPGVEIYAYAKNLNEWIEIGGAGLIRREITGIKRKDITVLAWGVGVDRLMLIRQDNNVKSISELYNSSIGWVGQRKVV